MLTDPPQVKKPYHLIGITLAAGLIVVALFLFSSHFRDTEYARIQSDEFEIVGRRLLMQKGEYFTGIKYADAPLFQHPIKLHPLNGFVDATRWSDGCPNAHIPNVDENCARLNVYRCERPKNGTLFPVLVYLPGLDYGSILTSKIDPALVIPKIACRGIIFVTVDYRTGPYGFFTTHDGVAPGNNGLYDVKAALEWVNENIVHFGGDSGRITLMGSRLGARLASYLSLNEETRRLFKQLILLSGSSFVPSFITDVAKDSSSPKLMYDSSKDFTAAAKCLPDEKKWTNDSKAILECLKNLQNRRVAVSMAVKRMKTQAWVKWPVVVDGQLVKTPVDKLEISKSNMSTLIGLCPTISKRKVNLRKHDIFRRLEVIEDLKNANKSDALLTHYADMLSGFKSNGGKRMNRLQLRALVNQVHQDFIEIGPLLKEAYGRAALGEKVYLFDYAYNFKMNRLRRLSNNPLESSLDSEDDDPFKPKFRNKRHPFRINEPCGLDLLFNKARNEFDEPLSDIVSGLLSNFVSKADPIPAKTSGIPKNWPLFSLTTEYYLQIRNSIMKIGQLPNRESVEFWLCKLPTIYGRNNFCRELGI